MITGHSGGGTLKIRGLSNGTGRFDAYGTFGVTTFTDHRVPGRLTDYSATKSAMVVGAYTLQTMYTDIDGIPRTVAGDTTGALWSGSSGGPTRDGRLGVDITAPGENVFASYSPTAYWTTFRFNLINDGGGWYGRQGATSGAGPIVVGAVALMLQENPKLTEREVKQILHETAREDHFTGETPNLNWGYGKLNVFFAVLNAKFRGGDPFIRSLVAVLAPVTTTTQGAGVVGGTIPAMRMTADAGMSPAGVNVPMLDGWSSTVSAATGLHFEMNRGLRPDSQAELNSVDAAFVLAMEVEEQW